MADAGDNELVLSARLLKAAEVRVSPAGIPIARLWVEHDSQQPEAQRARGVRFRIEVRASGQTLVEQARTLAEGDWLRVRGHLARPDQRSEPRRLIVVARELERITDSDS